MKIDKAPMCPHCGIETSEYKAPPFNFSDGLGWGTPFLYVCFNDNCPLFVNGWKHMEENYGQVASYRYMVMPDSGEESVMPAFSIESMRHFLKKTDETEESE